MQDTLWFRGSDTRNGFGPRPIALLLLFEDKPMTQDMGWQSRLNTEALLDDRNKTRQKLAPIYYCSAQGLLQISQYNPV